MSLITAIGTIAGLDVFLLGLLAYVLWMPFRFGREAATPRVAAPGPSFTVADRARAGSRPVRGVAARRAAYAYATAAD